MTTQEDIKTVINSRKGYKGHWTKHLNAVQAIWDDFKKGEPGSRYITVLTDAKVTLKERWDLYEKRHLDLVTMADDSGNFNGQQVVHDANFDADFMKQQEWVVYTNKLIDEEEQVRQKIRDEEMKKNFSQIPQAGQAQTLAAVAPKPFMENVRPPEALQRDVDVMEFNLWRRSYTIYCESTGLNEKIDRRTRIFNFLTLCTPEFLEKIRSAMNIDVYHPNLELDDLLDQIVKHLKGDRLDLA